jgi:hypothetical protein
MQQMVKIQIKKPSPIKSFSKSLKKKWEN